jgi:hypothetical protein
MATRYPFSSLSQNRECFGEAGFVLAPCPVFLCIHTPCHDPDYLADQEDKFRDLGYHTRLWWEYRETNPICYISTPPYTLDEDARRRDEEARQNEEKWSRAFNELDEIKALSLPPESEEYQRNNLYAIVTNHISDEERKDFESKFDRCRRLESKNTVLQRDMRRFYVKRELEQLKALDRCQNKDTQAYREVAEYRDQILASVAETRD